MTYRRVTPGSAFNYQRPAMPEDEFMMPVDGNVFVDRPTPPMQRPPMGGGLVDRPSPPMSQHPFFGMGGQNRPFFGMGGRGRFGGGMRERMMNRGWQTPFFGGNRWR